WSLLGDSARAAMQCRLGLIRSSSLLHKPIVGALQLKGVNHHVASSTPMLFNLAA
ncbi:hypothetical protein Bca52824_096216, partial [Brassica carinata]